MNIINVYCVIRRWRFEVIKAPYAQCDCRIKLFTLIRFNICSLIESKDLLPQRVDYTEELCLWDNVSELKIWIQLRIRPALEAVPCWAELAHTVFYQLGPVWLWFMKSCCYLPAVSLKLKKGHQTCVSQPAVSDSLFCRRIAHISTNNRWLSSP